MKFVIATALTIGLGGVALAQSAPTADPALVDKYAKAMWAKAGPEWASSISPDETMALCSQTRNAPTGEQFAKITEREKATIVMPADGNVMGDWKKGETVAQRGTGGQFTDTAETYRGGNCYACHELAPAEVSYGTLGPSLKAYGKMRAFSKEDAKTTYAKIFNPQSVMACSQMPRFGHSKFLTEQQIKDVVAYLFDPDSPVNK